jgi:hypothetical protein
MEVYFHAFFPYPLDRRLGGYRSGCGGEEIRDLVNAPAGI